MYGVILAGGGGTRLWPQSRARLPKPFLPLLPDGSTMIQATFNRLTPLIPAERLFVATGRAYAELVRAQLPALPAANLIIEPSARDNAAAVGLAMVQLTRYDSAAVVGVFAADHLILDEAGFRADLTLAEQVAAHGYLVTLGMTPTQPETRYGYVAAAGPVPELGATSRARVVERFVEKPDAATAATYLASGRHYWNAGIFVWRLDVILEQFRTLQPEMAARLGAIQRALGSPEAQTVLEREWESLPRTSIDYAIMEKSSRVATIPSAIGWSDVGDWNAIGELLGRTGGDYVAAGIDYLDHDSHRCVVTAPAGKLVAAIGVDDLVIVDTPDALLICPRSRSQEVRQIVDRLKSSGREDLL